jgi:NADPH:quinone reductase-like Zn-dependent oxidoreductase
MMYLFTGARLELALLPARLLGLMEREVSFSESFSPSGASLNGSLGHRRTVTATASTQEKLDWMLSIPNGPTHAINYKTQDFSKEVQKITNNKGVDVLVDIVGQSHWHQNMASLAFDGRMSIIAFLSGESLCSCFSSNLMTICYRSECSVN